MYTANTMASAIEALGMSLPYSSSFPATARSLGQAASVLGKLRLLLPPSPPAPPPRGNPFLKPSS